MNDPMAPEELQASRARAEAATAEPWEIEREEIEGLDLFDEEPLGFPRTIGPISYWEHSLDSHSAEEVAQVEADAEFIAHARTDVPRLHATIAARDEEIERLQSEVARLQQQPDEWEQYRARNER